MTALPQPPHWRDNRTTILLGLVLFGVSGVASAILAIARVMSGSYLTACILLGATIFCVGLATASARSVFGTVPLRATYDSTGTTLQPDPVTTTMALVALFALIPSGTLYVIYVPRGSVDLPLGDGERIFSPILIGLAVAVAVWGLIALVRRRTTGYVKLTREGFELANLVLTQKGSWDDVVDITDEYADKQGRHPTVFVMKDGKPKVLKNTSGFAPNGAALYWMIRHYWKHPLDRGELIDGSAIARLREEQFVSD
jgi:hypothetical protein